MNNKLPVVWTIGGSDPCGGAGILADLKVFQSLSVWSGSIITAITAQNTEKSLRSFPNTDTAIREQWLGLIDDMPPAVIKLGLLGNPNSINTIAELIQDLKNHSDVKVICDPILSSSKGHSLTSDNLAASYRKMFPLIDLLTPNLIEAEILTGIDHKQNQSEELATALMSLGAKAVVIKGGHELNEHWSSDFFLSKSEAFWTHSPRLEGEFHGTGCVFASSISAWLAKGESLDDAIVLGRANLYQSLQNSQSPGKGRKLPNPSFKPVSTESMPTVTDSLEMRKQEFNFPPIDQDLGLYPIVNRAEWINRLAPLGVTTIQLRIKDLKGKDLANEVAAGVKLGKELNCRIIINDYIDLAIEYDAWGIHLGQEDLDDADLNKIRNSKLRLGISTHCYREAARAASIRPSYIALGPIFETTCKSMAFGPRGLEKIKEWQRLFACPIVAIGGLKLLHKPALEALKVAGIALISDITENENPEKRAMDWLTKT